MQTRGFQFFVFLTSVLILAGCAGGSGTPPWAAGQSRVIQAQAAPNQLSAESTLTPFPSENAAQTSSTIEQDRPAPASPLPRVQQVESSNLRPVKVGFLVPLSGQHKNLGQAMLNAAQMAVFDLGYSEFELLPRDTEGNFDGARKAARSAIDDGAELILGPVFADAVRGAKGPARGSGVNIVAFSTDWSVAGGNVHTMGFLPFDQIERIISYAAQNDLREIGVLSPNTKYGDAAIGTYRSLAPEYGVFSPGITRFAAQSKNLTFVIEGFSRYRERLQAQNEILISQGLLDLEKEPPRGFQDVDEELVPAPFDAVFMPFGGDAALSVSNLLSFYDLPPSGVKRLGTGLWDDTALAREAAMNGAWFASPMPQPVEDFKNRYFGLYGSTPPRLVTLAYDATALASVLAQAGLRNDGEPYFDRNSIQNPNGFAGIDGIFRFRQNGLVERGLAILEFNNGKIRLLDKAPRTFQRVGPS